MKSYVVLLAVWMAAFGTAGVYSASAAAPLIIALATPSANFASPAFEADHHDRHRSGTPSPAIIHGPSYLSALREYDVRSLTRRFSYGSPVDFKLNIHGD